MSKTLFAQVITIDNPKVMPSDLSISPDCDIFGFRFVQCGQVLSDAVLNLIRTINKPLLFIGTGDDETDKLLFADIIKKIDKKGCIFANITEKNYKDIIPTLIEGEHYAVLKTPIDINLAKELNILSLELGLPKDKIIMNTDIGGLGYGYEYGFSIMEKVRQESIKDEYLNFPIFSDASFEALKTKEAKSDDFSASWGKQETRAKMIELSACAGAIAAGASIITVNYPENLSRLKGLV